MAKGCNKGCNATEVAATRAAVAPAADDLRLRGGRLQQQAAGLVEVRVRLQRPRELSRLRVRHQSLHSAPGSVGHLRRRGILSLQAEGQAEGSGRGEGPADTQAAPIHKVRCRPWEAPPP